MPDPDQRRVERLMMGLRVVEGIERRAVTPLDETVVRELSHAGLLRADDERIALTSDGMRLASAVTVRLL
jgi:coproporphyrinogen III oxidase-like Fe-S oxidoreductase